MEELKGLGFDLLYSNNMPGGTEVRYTDGVVTVDVLGPAEQGRHADLATSDTGHTIQMAGGQQALDRTEYVRCRFKNSSADIPRPSLLGAIICKAAAVEHRYGDPPVYKHSVDLAFLLSLVNDPDAMRNTMNRSDVNRLRLCRTALSDSSDAWRVQDPDSAAYGQSVYNDLIL